MTDSVEQRLARVRASIEDAASRSGRDGQVALVAVSKTFPIARIMEAYAAGQRLFGENRVQEGVEKVETLRGKAPDIVWHLIGHLQSNKARQAAEWFDFVESVDSVRLAEKLAERAAIAGKTLPILLEVNVAGEETKAGFSPDELRRSWAALLAMPHLEPRGLMTVAPLVRNSEEARPVFRALRELRDEIAQASGRSDFAELSMGMSGDYEVAIEEGATIVRIGRAIFGERS